MSDRPIPTALLSGSSLLDDFRNPPVAFRPVPLWSWNEAIEPAEVRRQTDLIADAGLGGGFIHVRVGLTSGYMNDAWWSAVDAAVDQSCKRGLKVWLYDEDRWPSGYAGGSVPLASEQFRMKGLLARPIDALVPSDCTPIGSPRDGIQLYAWTSPLGNDWFHGTCYGDLLSGEAMSHFLSEAYASYHARYGERYGSDVLAEFTDEPNAMHRSRLPKGLLPYTTKLEERFLQMHGYDALPLLHLLFVDAPHAARFRLHYFRTINDLFETNFSKQLGDWCVDHGISFTGHYMAEHTLYEQQLWGVKVMANYRHQGVPGIDHLFRQVSETVTAKQCQSVVNQYGKRRMLSELYGVAGGSMTFADRAWIASQQICLGVNLLCPHLLLYTMAGARKRDYPQNMFYQQPWWPLNRVIDDRLSRLCVALSHGRYVSEVLILHPQESTFVHWRTRSAPDPTDQSDKVMWEFDSVMPEVKPLINKLDAQLAAITAALFGTQRTFDFGDETILRDIGAIDGAKLCVGEMSYGAVIIPSMTTIAVTTLDLLERFQHAGGKVICCGEMPTLLDGERSLPLHLWLKRQSHVGVSELAAAVARDFPPAVTIEGISAEEAATLYAHVRDLGDASSGLERLVFLSNLNRLRTFEADVAFAGDYTSASLLDTHSGEQRSLIARRKGDCLHVKLPFAEGESHLLRLHMEAADDVATRIRPPVTQRWEIEPSRWSMRRLDDNALTLDLARWREGENGELSAKAIPVIAIQQRLNELKYDGPLTLRYSAHVDGLAATRKVHLVVEHPDRYEIRVNGQPVRYAGLPFYRDIRWLPIDVSGLLRDGENEIELSCDFRHGDPRSVHDAWRRYGTEIESIYLIGDFDVSGEFTGERRIGEGWARAGLPEPIVSSLRAGSAVLTESTATLLSGDSVLQGLPFYAGRLVMTARITAEVAASARNQITAGGRVLLAIETLDCPVASVEVDGVTVGHFACAPLEVDITDALKSGGNFITITLYGTLRNLMGAHHHPYQEQPAEHPHTFEPIYPPGLDRAEAVRKWGDADRSGINWIENYALISFAALGRVELRARG